MVSTQPAVIRSLSLRLWVPTRVVLLPASAARGVDGLAERLTRLQLRCRPKPPDRGRPRSPRRVRRVGRAVPIPVGNLMSATPSRSTACSVGTSLRRVEVYTAAQLGRCAGAGSSPNATIPGLRREAERSTTANSTTACAAVRAWPAPTRPKIMASLGFSHPPGVEETQTTPELPDLDDMRPTTEPPRIEPTPASGEPGPPSQTSPSHREARLHRWARCLTAPS